MDETEEIFGKVTKSHASYFEKIHYTDALRELAEEVPVIIRQSLKILSDGKDWEWKNLGLLFYLLKHGESRLDKMAEDLSIPEEDLEIGLRPLVSSALVSCFPRGRGDDYKPVDDDFRHFFVYAPSIMGEDIVIGLIEAYTPRLKVNVVDKK